ncbi:hypothetical protein JOD47_001310 [Arthrobacter tumbae]|nr:hypothetical protein [Arthrobacter tumbae]
MLLLKPVGIIGRERLIAFRGHVWLLRLKGNVHLR